MRVAGTVIAALAALAGVAAAITCVAKSRKQEIKNDCGGIFHGKVKVGTGQRENRRKRCGRLQED